MKTWEYEARLQKKLGAKGTSSAAYFDVCEQRSSRATTPIFEVWRGYINFIRIILLFLPIFIYGCTTIPSKINEELKFINIITDDSIEGSECYSMLRQLLKTNNTPKYNLYISITYQEYPLIISNFNIVRQGIQENVNFKLIDKANVLLLEKNFRLLGAYDIVTALYSSYSESEKIRYDLSVTAAREIQHRLVLFFLKEKNL